VIIQVIKMKKIMYCFIVVVILLNSCSIQKSVPGQDVIVPFKDLKGNVIPFSMRVKNFDDYRFFMTEGSVLNEKLAFYGLEICSEFLPEEDSGNITLKNDTSADNYVIYSLLSLNGINSVTAGSRTYTLDDFKDRVSVYYARYTNDKQLFYVPVLITPGPDSVLEKMAYICSNPILNDSFSCINPGSKIVEYSEKNNCLYLTMNDEFFRYGGTLREEGIIGQLARMYNEYERIYIVNEEYTNFLPEGTEIKEGIETTKIINKIDLW
jgi:hypothetical protein